ncbi:MAG TPA: hypothetical protein VGM56_25065 [Byssovorax sp.]|jgi:hypothetical protein
MYRDAPGCFEGVETCQDDGLWGPCEGGVQPAQQCYLDDQTACHALTAMPFTQRDLHDGLGQFDVGVDANSEVFTIACPSGVTPCLPARTGGKFAAFQSGEYDVTYQATRMGQPISCTYPFIVGIGGLRVELTWEHPLNDSANGVDLDLHLHQPGDTRPWKLDGGKVDCGFANCAASAFTPPSGTSPSWFADPPAAPPQAVNWWNDPSPGGNNCYTAPAGEGQTWRQYGMGCHNPRLESDVITCDPTITTPANTNICRPETIAIDYPPPDTWMRVGVLYYSNHGAHYSVHPVVKVFCGGHIAAEISQYDMPAGPLTFAPSDGAGGPNQNTFWYAADVRFPTDPCGRGECEVVPISTSPTTREPYLSTGHVADQDFGPAYPP